MSQDILERVLASPRLPSLPTVALEVIELVQQQDVNIRQIANTIQHDAALSTKILKTVNSSFYGPAYSISTVSHALVVLGLNSVKSLALGFSLVNNMHQIGGEGFDHVDFWKRSVYGSAAARALAKQVGLVQQEEAFLGGLLQDLGMLAMSQTLGTQYNSIVAEAGTEHRRLATMEMNSLETDHASVGAALAEHWKLPPVLVDPIRFHEVPDGAPEDMLPLICCVAIGSRVADVFISAEPGGALDIYYRLVEQHLQISREDAEPLLKDIARDTEEMHRLFDLPTGDLGNPDEILARANEAMIQISLEQQRETSQLEDQKRQLTKQILLDGLTGVANRRHFNDFIAEQFRVTQESNQPLSLLFVDADNFKGINDAYGHQTGDRVLVELAGAFKDAMPESSLVARYGGEKFAAVLPATDLKGAAHLAESMRREIERITIGSDDGQALWITVSTGVATFDGSVFTSVEQLIKAADQGVYAAKAAGRNCVRIFAPKAVA